MARAAASWLSPAATGSASASAAAAAAGRSCRATSSVPLVVTAARAGPGEQRGQRGLRGRQHPGRGADQDRLGRPARGGGDRPQPVRRSRAHIATSTRRTPASASLAAHAVDHRRVAAHPVPGLTVRPGHGGQPVGRGRKQQRHGQVAPDRVSRRPYPRLTAS